MKAIRHIGIVVRDLEKMLHFYGDLLGLKIIKKMDESGGFIDTITAIKSVKVTTVKMEADDGNLIELLYFHRPANKPAKKKDLCDSGISHIAFTVQDADAEYERLTAENIVFNSRPQLSPDGSAKVAFLRDPEGNYIELVEVLGKK